MLVQSVHRVRQSARVQAENPGRSHILLCKLTLGLQDTEDLVAGDRLDLSNTVGVSERDTNLRRSETLLGKLGDVVDHLRSGHLEPTRRGPTVRLGRPGNTLTARTRMHVSGEHRPCRIVLCGQATKGFLMRVNLDNLHDSPSFSCLKGSLLPLKSRNY